MISLVLPPQNRKEPVAKTIENDSDKEDRQNHSAQNNLLVINDEQAESPNQALYEACMNYLNSLEKALGCKFCKCWQNFWNTPKAEHIKKRIEEVGRLAESLLDPDQNLDNFRAGLQNMTVPEKDAGTLFVKYCKTILNSYQNKREVHDDSEGWLCIFCREHNKDICYLPCRHLVYDNECYQKLTDDLKQRCPKCAAYAVNTLHIDPKICMVCFETPADMVSLDCGHAAICQNCDIQENKPAKTCKYCKVPTRLEKMFIN
jgi:hypothetical protein